MGAALAGALALATIPSDAAATEGQRAPYVVSGHCYADGEDFTVTLRYITGDTDEWYVDYMTYTINNDATYNNVVLRVRDTDNHTYWQWTSGDDVTGGVSHRKEVDTYVPKAKATYGYGWVNADQPVDSTCSTRTTTF